MTLKDKLAKYNQEILKTQKTTRLKINTISEATAKEIRTTAANRKDFDLYLEAANKYKPSESRENLEAFLQEQTKILLRIVNRRNKARAKKEKNMLGDTFDSQYTNKRFLPNKTLYEYNKFSRSLFKQSVRGYADEQYSQYKNNYIAALYNPTHKIYKATADAIALIVRTFPAETVYFLSVNNKLSNFDFIYSPDRAGDIIGDVLLSFWESQL